MIYSRNWHSLRMARFAGDDGTRMIVNERRPTLTGRLPRTPTLL